MFDASVDPGARPVPVREIFLWGEIPHHEHLLAGVPPSARQGIIDTGQPPSGKYSSGENSPSRKFSFEGSDPHLRTIRCRTVPIKEILLWGKLFVMEVTFFSLGAHPSPLSPPSGKYSEISCSSSLACRGYIHSCMHIHICTNINSFACMPTNIVCACLFE